MSVERLLPFLSYYAREGYSRQLQSICAELLKKKPQDPFLVFWKSYGLICEGSQAEALRELQAMPRSPDMELAATAAMIVAHEAAKVVDQEAILDLSSKLELAERSSSDTAVLHLASFYMHTGRIERARSLAERVVRASDDNVAAQTLLGWIMVGQQIADEDDDLNDSAELHDAMSHFDIATNHDAGDLEAFLGKAKCYEILRQPTQALEVLTELWVRNQWFLPALLEKAKLLLATGSWEQLQECVTRIMQLDPQNILALTLAALQCIVRDGNNKVATKYLQDMLAAINRFEPKNAKLCYNLVLPFSRLASHDSQLLAACGALAEKMMQLQPENPVFMVEWAYQKLQTGEWVVAQERFTAALNLDELNMEANCGLVECQLCNNEIEEAASHLQFLQEMITTAGSKAVQQTATAHLQYLTALLAFKSKPAEALQEAEKALELQLQCVAGQPITLQLYAALNPGRILSLVRLMHEQAGGQPRSSTKGPSPILLKCTRALELLSKWVPGLRQASVLLAQTLYLSGSLEAALRKASDLLVSSPDDSTAHLLVCNIYLQQDKPQMAMAALEQAISANFAVRDSLLYHIVNARVLAANEKLEEAKKVLEFIMTLPGVRTPITQQQRGRLGKSASVPTLNERATVYLLLAEVLTRLSKMPDPPEAKKYITDALREFTGTPEEVRVTIADCQMAIARGDVEGALKRLRQITSSSPHFPKARMAMAEIYLKHRRDKASYIKCYMDLKARHHGYETCCMLGEALLHIQEHEKSIQEFQEALETYNPKDSELAWKIGRVLMVVHDYQRAIDYYNKAIRNAPGDIRLQHELASCLVRMQQWGPAEACLQRCLDRTRQLGNGTETLQYDVETWLLMAKVHHGVGSTDAYIRAQKKALELQVSLVGQLRGEMPTLIEAQREKAAQICYDLAEYFSSMRKFPEAIEMYKEALKQLDTHAKSMQALAKLHLSNGDTDSCQQLCAQLLKHDPDNQEAAIMLAELMFHKESYDSAMYQFQKLLEKAPRHYQALSQLVALLRRAGRLEAIPSYFEIAESSHPKACMDPGLHYCKGLHHRYMNQPREALTEFNMVRNDSQWGTPALLEMAEIYLNPDNDAIWQDKDNMSTPEARDALNTAKSLLQQVRPADTTSTRFKVLECYAMIATRERGEVEEAISRLSNMGADDPNNVPVMLCLATAFTLLKQTPKARNQLKRVSKIPHKPAEAEEFERSWLLLADIHIQGGKYDLAQELCQRCLKYNKSCAAAWETLGAIMEREQSYKDAAEHYENAWKYQHYASPQVGFKLAFNYLKAKRLVEAIDICVKVMKEFPDYPRVRKEILEKARLALRP